MPRHTAFIAIPRWRDPHLVQLPEGQLRNAQPAAATKLEAGSLAKATGGSPAAPSAPGFVKRAADTGAVGSGTNPGSGRYITTTLGSIAPCLTIPTRLLNS